jgi:hypothetical protein
MELRLMPDKSAGEERVAQWVCPHGVTHSGSCDFISGARNAHNACCGDADYSRAYQDEYQRLWHEARVQVEQLTQEREHWKREYEECCRSLVKRVHQGADAVHRAEQAEADVSRLASLANKRAAQAEQAESELARVRERDKLIEDFCESHLPFASEKSEVIARRVLWAIRGSNENPPHPDRAALSESEEQAHG